MSNQIKGIKSMSINIDSPLKLNIPHMEFNKLCLLVGTNGSGKSILLKLNWIMNFISYSYLVAKEHSVTTFDLLKFAQECFDKTFTNQNFNGKINVDFDDGNDIVIEIDKGKVIKFDIKFDKGLTSSGVPLFMSTETRTYDDIRKYLLMRKTLGIVGSITPSVMKEFETLNTMYKLYDVVFLEKFYTSLIRKPLLLNKQVKDALKSQDIGINIESIGIDEVNSDLYYIDDKGITKSLCTLSKGQQSLINMYTANLL